MIPTVVHRPWGTYVTLASEDASYLLKRIVVRPGARLSLQSHAHRSEHWVVLRGRGTAVVGADTLTLGPNTHVYIPTGVKHRLVNTATEAEENGGTLELIEVQTGALLSEDDIVRYEDDYARA